MAKLSQEHFRSLYIHIHNQTHNGAKIDHKSYKSVTHQLWPSYKLQDKDKLSFENEMSAVYSFYPVQRQKKMTTAEFSTIFMLFW